MSMIWIESGTVGNLMSKCVLVLSIFSCSILRWAASERPERGVCESRPDGIGYTMMLGHTECVPSRPISEYLKVVVQLAWRLLVPQDPTLQRQVVQ